MGDIRRTWRGNNGGDQTSFTHDYCKTLNICGIKISGFNEKGKLVHFNFGGHDTSRLQLRKKI